MNGQGFEWSYPVNQVQDHTLYFPVSSTIKIMSLKLMIEHFLVLNT